jgi:hypothetical protein
MVIDVRHTQRLMKKLGHSSMRPLNRSQDFLSFAYPVHIRTSTRADRQSSSNGSFDSAA